MEGEVRCAVREAACFVLCLVYSHNVRAAGLALAGAVLQNCPVSKVIQRRRIRYRRWEFNIGIYVGESARMLNGFKWLRFGPTTKLS
jgi:hypothetical protein